MPRKARKNLNTNYFHVMVQGINKSEIFKRKREKNVYIKMIQEISQDFEVTIWTFCVMDNHTHFLIHANRINELSSFMKLLNLKYSIYYNKSHNRVGYVFRDRYRSEGIFSERQFFICAHYIINNPVKAGICVDPFEYEFSYCTNKLKGFVTAINDEDKESESFIDVYKEKENYKVLACEYIRINNLKIYDSVVDREKLIDYMQRQRVKVKDIAEFIGISAYQVNKIKKALKNCP